MPSNPYGPLLRFDIKLRDTSLLQANRVLSDKTHRCRESAKSAAWDSRPGPRVR
jgi:hypothetical protein